jgi:hypothetical protein
MKPSSKPKFFEGTQGYGSEPNNFLEVRLCSSRPKFLGRGKALAQSQTLWRQGYNIVQGQKSFWRQGYISGSEILFGDNAIVQGQKTFWRQGYSSGLKNCLRGQGKKVCLGGKAIVQGQSVLEAR